jgi:E3 ubiquitin-protein ligase BRE1
LKLLQVRQQLADVEHSLQSTQRRNQELQERCNELSRQCETERRARMDVQKELTKAKGAKKDGSNKSASGGAAGGSAGGGAGAGGGAPRGDDADMLDLTLEMLRCSVCKDRFKNTAITRCFHLFCKECIDENLRNRSRKCPLCGEKFGQDDVSPVFFN